MAETLRLGSLGLPFDHVILRIFLVGFHANCKPSFVIEA